MSYTGTQYEKDLAEFKAKLEGEKAYGYTTLLDMSRLNPEKLKHTGHKNMESALLWTINSIQKSIAKIVKEFLKKYPD